MPSVHPHHLGISHADHPVAIEVEHEISATQTGRTEEAEKLLREAVRIRTENVPGNTFFTRHRQWRALGEFLSAQKRFPEVTTFLRPVMKAGESRRGKQSAHAARAAAAR